MDVKAVRKLLNMDRKEFAEAIGVDQSAISRYEQGKMRPSKARVERIEYLLAEKGYDKPGVVIEQVKYDDSNAYSRLNEYARRLIIQGAGGCCELCGKKAPFLDKEGRPYLCLHEVDGDDSVEVTQRYVALCPNCNAKINVLADPQDTDKIRVVAQRHSY